MQVHEIEAPRSARVVVSAFEQVPSLQRGIPDQTAAQIKEGTYRYQRLLKENVNRFLKAICKTLIYNY